MNMQDSHEDETRLLAFLQDEWRRYSPAQLRRGVWVSSHEAIVCELGSERADPMAQPLQRAWWVDWDSIQPRPPQSFKVFCDYLTVGRAQEPHPIGWSSFAPFPQAPFYFVDNFRGPLDGDGWRVRVSAGGVEVLEKLWVS
ncbi:hypothetical protein [Lysobacter enzymogenes]|uniref:hypothetical protein n=1 Tax=Lysobacter enzymogenes TaxID=69 RepID=UPI001A96104D|nr:hypothetical protein [Lysobacter enzymogenes]QQP94106.1 hypothetical protein JHW38_12540 [Lysobacter enzymogenes]